jgi:hypothetical protein
MHSSTSWQIAIPIAITMNSILSTKLDTLEPSYLELFDKLLIGIEQRMKMHLPDADRFQNCFWTAIQHYKELKQQVLEKGFANDLEEIEFFKEIKPKFTSYIEFFVICTESLWYTNNYGDCSSMFWKAEAERYTRFCKRYYSFILYHESGNRDMDKNYFLQATRDPIGGIYSKMFDEKPFLHSSKDWLVRSYLAHKMYDRFVKEQLAHSPPTTQ